MQNFDLIAARKMSHDDLTTYLTKWFFPLKTGNHVMIQNNKPVIYKPEKLRHTYFARLPKKQMNSILQTIVT